MTEESYGTLQTRGRFTMLELDGFSVSLMREGNSGQLMVHISTEDAATRVDPPADHAENGDPLLMVTLNDATLYDRMASEDQPRVMPATWNLDAEAYEV